MKYDFVRRYLSAGFLSFGFHIGKHPMWYIIVPLVVTATFSIGFAFIKIRPDLEYFLTPLDGRSRTERAAVESLFPNNKTEAFDVARCTRLPAFGSVIVVAQDGDHILRTSILNEIAVLNSIILNISVTNGNQTFKYTDICSRTYDGFCFSNDGLKIREKLSEMKRGKYKIRYPVDIDPISFSFSAYVYNFGGVTTDDESYVQKALSFRLLYFVDDFRREDMAEKWMDAFLDKVSELKFTEIEVSRFIRKSMDEETNKVTITIFPMLIIAATLMIGFGAVSCMTVEWVSSKPWLGIAGCASSLIGTAGAFGFLLLCGAEYVDINIAIAFLMLGIGMDDSFVILAAWRLTDPKDSVEKRMGKAFSDAALSITITSLTNVLANCTGLATPYRLMRVYSLYAMVSVLFVYLTQITFFGGCLALSGYREKKNLHAIFCFPVERDNPSSKGFLYSVVMHGCTNMKYINIKSDPTKNVVADTIFELIGKYLSNAYVKLTVVVTFAIYLGTGIYCLKYLDSSFDATSAFPYYSYANTYVKQEYRYFSEYPFSVHVVINKTLDYSDPKVWANVEDLLFKIESLPYMAGSMYTESWLRQYRSFVNDGRFWFALRNFNMSNSEDFLEGLRDVFLRFKGAHRFRKDVVFSEDGKSILASRFMVQAKNINNAVVAKKHVEDLWSLVDSFEYPIYVHNYNFLKYDISSAVESTTIQCLCVSSALVIIVFISFCPNIIAAVCVAFSIMSIELGLIGFVALWKVPLNIISMGCLVLSVGLCVDYSAHLSYAYISCKESNPNAKLRHALLSVGYPIVQGCVSTILGVFILTFAPMTPVIIFFKISFLVMVLSLLHGILLQPVLLCLCEEFWQYILRIASTYCARLANSRNENTELDAAKEEML